jgi:Phage tail assembly chaperone proteins, E, or 41 or 14
MEHNLQVDSPLVPRYDREIPPGNGAAAQAQPEPTPPQPRPTPQPPPPQPKPEPQPQPGDAEPQPQAQDARPFEEPKPIAWRNGKLAMPLRKKVQAHGEMLDVLTIREPTGGDIERIGQPVIFNIFDPTPRPVYDTPVMTAMISHLAAVPPSTVRSLDPRDWQNIALGMFHFFMPDRWTQS